MKTKLDGIEFRSRTEAAWFHVFQRFGLDPVYEPETVEITNIWDRSEPEFRSCWYMPDFTISLHGTRMFAEIKAGVEGEAEDIAKACLLGYRVPTLIVVGWPLLYRAVVINERSKGNPHGYEVLFRSDIANNLCVTQGRYVRLFSSYPDENWLEMNEAEEFTPKHTMAEGTAEGDVGRDAWNRTKWNR
jgi:hypothetical protein